MINPPSNNHDNIYDLDLVNNYNELPLILEALLLASGKSLTIKEMLELFEDHQRPTNEEILAALKKLGQQNAYRGVELVCVANGYQFITKSKYAHIVSKLWQEKPHKYSRAFLETLALIAYRQPITRGEIEQIRGVSINTNIFKTLQEERGWIRVVGYKDVAGKPQLYATTKDFLSYFGLEKLDQLPPLPKIIEILDKEKIIT